MKGVKGIPGGVDVSGPREVEREGDAPKSAEEGMDLNRR